MRWEVESAFVFVLSSDILSLFYRTATDVYALGLSDLQGIRNWPGLTHAFVCRGLRTAVPADATVPASCSA
jgi:hypothetical protein